MTMAAKSPVEIDGARYRGGPTRPRPRERGGPSLRSVAVSVLLVGVAIAAVVALVPRAAPPGLPSAARVSYLNLTVSYNATTGMCIFTPGNMSVVAGTDVKVTITNYDTRTAHLFVAGQDQVMGTSGSTEMVQMGPNAPALPTSGIAPSDISHTFTILDSIYNLSVPIPPAATHSLPAIVSFDATFGTKGTFQWGCMADCSDLSMGSPGAMFGDLTVT
jgi:hypothetical protein